jgi:hypothetical protein
MPTLRRPYSEHYDDERRRTWMVPLVAVIALLAAGMVGWTIGRAGGQGTTTRTVTRSVTAAVPPPSVYEHTPRGAVAAAQAFFYRRAITPQTGALAVTNPHPGQVGGDWQLLYRVKSYTPQAAMIETWGLELSYGFGSSSLDWSFIDVDVGWDGVRWLGPGGLTITPASATPPPNGTSGVADRSFGALLSPFQRFPGAP